MQLEDLSLFSFVPPNTLSPWTIVWLFELILRPSMVLSLASLPTKLDEEGYYLKKLKVLEKELVTGPDVR